MPESNWWQQRSPSPKPTPSMQPPISKFYHGPVAGWNSAESSPSQNGSTFSLSSAHEFSPSLPPRSSPGPSAHGSPQPSQGWHSPAPSAPTLSQLSNAPYLTNIYALTPGPSDVPVNPTWDSGPADRSAWGVNYRAKHPPAPGPVTKPPLPPRPNKPPDQSASYTSKPPSSRISATTIDVPLFLQHVAFDSVSAPPLPGRFLPSSQGAPAQVPTPAEPQRLPPPPPQKIPLDKVEASEIPTMIPKRPQYDPQQSYDGEQQQLPQKPRRPRFDPQNSHDNFDAPLQRQRLDRQPTIPVPHFTDFDVESALPPLQYDEGPSVSPPKHQPQSMPSIQNRDTVGNHATQHFHQPSISPVGSMDQDSWISIRRSGESRTGYVPSSEQHHLTLSQHDGQSISTADVSSNAAGKSTPDSQQTSNTSYKETENYILTSRDGRQGDDSFYWHSGRSSSDIDEEHSHSNSPIATPGEASTDQRSSTTNSTLVQHEQHDLPIRSTSLSPSTSAPYGASALGFGGPSDWEYFGDYEAEEIDDEDLYSRPKRQDKDDAPAGSAELPANYAPITSTPQLGEEARAPALESTLQEDLSLPRRSPIPHPDTGRSRESILQTVKASGKSKNAVDKSPHVESGRVTPRPFSGRSKVPLDQSPDQRPDLDEIIRAWSEAPYVGRSSAESPCFQGKEDGDKQSYDVAEASMASTPGGKMLRPGLGPKSAPSSPTLPTSKGQATSLEAQSRLDNESSAAPPNGALVSREFEGRGQEAYLILKSGQDSSSSDQRTGQAHQGEEICSPSQNNTDTEPGNTGPLPVKSEISSSPSNAIVTESVNASPSPGIFKVISRARNVSTNVDSQILDNNVALPEGMLPIEQPSLMQDESGATPQDHMHESSSELAYKVLVDHLNEDGPKIYDRGSYGASQSDELKSLQERHSHDLNNELSYKTLINKSEQKDSSKASNVEARKAPESSPSCENVADKPIRAGANEADMTTEHRSTKLDASEEQRQSAKSMVSSVGLQQSSELPPRIERAIDAYADLDPWGKASLNRFAAMLREESRAETNKDKLNIFNVFTSRESRLRVVLYGTEDELVNPQKGNGQEQPSSKVLDAARVPEVTRHFEKMNVPEKGGFVKQAVQRANTMSLQRSLKALPALPANRDSVVGLAGNALAPLVIQDNPEPVTDQIGPESESSPAEAQYSPGGRPIVDRISKELKGGMKDTSQTTTATSKVATGANVPHSPGFNAPIAIGSQDTVEMAKKPAYTPLKYNEPRSEVNNYLANRKSVIRPYATLTQGSLDSGSTFGRGLGVSDVATAIRAPTSQYNPVSKPNDGDTSDMMIKLKATTDKSQPDLRRFVKADFDPLLTILPDSEAVVSEPARLDELRSVMETIPDDFSFIHQSVVAWDARAKKQREENDRQRHVRQIESEQRIDALFDDHEIGYGDISELESEFKRSEAARKADEDRSEYQMFVSDVFTLVWTRLHYELDQLIPHYEQYCNLMNDTLAGKDMFEGSPDGLALAPTMNLFLTLHQKLEIRHQKAFEAVLERDRRLKKTEISPWYTLSNIAKVKQLEKQFEDAEKKAIIEYCQQRNARANRLMDVLDQNTLRGVGANQDYMEAIWKAVRRIASGRAFASVSGANEPTAGIEEMEKAKAVTTLLATSSEQIVQTFHVADMLLNSADYEVSVARAKVTDKLDLAALAKLKEERAKEDQKLMRDLEHRLALIREDTRRTNDEIVKLMLFLGVTNETDSSPALHAGPGDPGHEVRLQKALEEAKRRNALKESGC